MAHQSLSDIFINITYYSHIHSHIHSQAIKISFWIYWFHWSWSNGFFLLSFLYQSFRWGAPPPLNLVAQAIYGLTSPHTFFLLFAPDLILLYDLVKTNVYRLSGKPLNVKMSMVGAEEVNHNWTFLDKNKYHICRFCIVDLEPRFD